MIPSLLSRWLVWLRRIPHRRGYGIHSPFAFNLVTGVIYNAEAYYAYDALREQHAAWRSVWLEKDARLVFRLANHQEAQRVAMVAAPGDCLATYIRAARPSASVVNINPAAPLPLSTLLPAHDLVVLDGEWTDYLTLDSPTLLPDHSALIIVVAPHATPARKAMWQRLVASDTTVVSFDLHRFGLLYIRPKLNKQHYLISYL